jgi:hypothetical protein
MAYVRNRYEENAFAPTKSFLKNNRKREENKCNEDSPDGTEIFLNKYFEIRKSFI